MIARIRAALAAKKQDEQGFTLIELLVVVLIIGILAAIAIPVYLGQQEAARESAVKSDLTNSKLAIVSYFTKDPAATSIAATDATAIAAAGTALEADGFSDSADTQYLEVTAASSTSFCVVARVGAAGKVFYIDETAAPTELTGTATTCP